MKITTFKKSDQTLADLAKRVYGQIDDDNQKKRIENALLVANPQLSAIQSLQEGSLVMLPSIDGIMAPVTEENQTENPRGSIEARARTDIQNYRKQLVVAIDQEMEELNRQLEVINSAAAQIKAVENDQLNTLITNLQERYDNLKERQIILQSSE